MTDWYNTHKKENYTETDENERQARLSQIIDDFTNKFKPTLKTNAYFKFEKEKMNNARLGLYKTYMENLDHFEVLYKKLDRDLLKFIEVVKTLEKSENPEEDLKKL
jgi:predicted aminopeptidase